MNGKDYLETPFEDITEEFLKAKTGSSILVDS